MSKEKTNHTILLTEDNIINQLGIKNLLENFGYRVVTANNGQEAVEIYGSDTSIDLILMDIEMPILDGFEATRMIRDIEKQKGRDNTVPIITLSGSNMKEKCIAAGFDSYLSKPVETVELRKTLDEYLKISA